MQSRERFWQIGKLVRNAPDRPVVLTQKVEGEVAKIVPEMKVPVTEFRVVRGKTMGGGLSAEALRRARKNATRRS